MFFFSSRERIQFSKYVCATWGFEFIDRSMNFNEKISNDDFNFVQHNSIFLCVRLF